MPRPGPQRDIPPPLELECLKVLWFIRKGSVREVRKEMTRDRELAYTTVMTVLDRLERRGAVGRKKVGRMFVYEAIISLDALRSLAVKDLVEMYYDGSEEALLAYLQAKPPTNPVSDSGT